MATQPRGESPGGEERGGHQASPAPSNSLRAQGPEMSKPIKGICLLGPL